MSEDRIYGPADLLRKLEKERREEYVYRGEFRVFPPPLWPSKYRNGFTSEGGVQLDQAVTLRSSGKIFYFRLDFFRDPFEGQDPEGYASLMKREQLRNACMAYIRNALGYPLSEAMFQQAGWSSEGIDVSYDPRVALSFALMSWDSRGGRLKVRKEPAALYRWHISPRSWTFDDLRTYNYLSCPSLIPTREICRLFPTGSNEEFRDSLLTYQEAIHWDMLDFDLESLQGKRPFERICLPETWAGNSRVERQKAALLLPDTSRREALAAIGRQNGLGMMSANAIDGTGHRLSVRDSLGHGNFVEDVSSRPGVERFLVDVSNRRANQDVSRNLSKALLPSFDDTFDLLVNWIQPHFRSVTSVGTLPMDVGLKISDFSTLWEALGQDEPERQFSR